MPPKKAAGPPPAPAPGSDEPSMMSADGGAGDSKGKKRQSDINQGESTLGIEEYMMPRMMSVRLAKGVLPPQTLIHKDAATAMQFSTSVFLNHIANAANEHTINAGRKNISPQDILEGIKETEWGFLVPQLEEELGIYVRTVNDKRNEYRRRLKERDSGIGAADGATKSGADGQDDDDMDGADDGPQAKRARLSDGVTLDESQMDEDLPDDEQGQDGEEDEGDGDQDDEEPDDEEDEEEQYGSAAEELQVDNDDEMDDRGDEGESDDESD